MKTFSVCMLFVLGMVLGTLAQAQTTLHMYPSTELKIRNGDVTPLVQMFADRSPERGMGVWGYGQVTDGYQNLYGGPTLKFDSLIEVGAGVGFERLDGDASWRYGTFVASFYGPLEFAWYHEMGESNWDRLQGLVTFDNHLKAGVMGQTDYGVGPRLDVLIPKLHATLWIAAMGAITGDLTIIESLAFNF